MAGIQMFDLGPPRVDTFSMISNLGKSFFDAYDAQRRRAAEDRKTKWEDDAAQARSDEVKMWMGGNPSDAPAQPSRAISEVGRTAPSPQPRPPSFTQTGGQMSNVNTSGFTPELSSLLAEFKSTFPEVRITSGYRDPTYNAKVGGASGSQHIHGKAFDFSVRDLPEERQIEIANWLRSKGAQGFGYYPNSRSMHADLAGARAWGPDYTRNSLGQTPKWFQQFAGNPNPVAPPSGPPPVAGRSMVAYAGVPRTQVASASPGMGYAPDTQPAAPAPQPVPFEQAIPGAMQFASLGGVGGAPTMPAPQMAAPAPQAAPVPPPAPPPAPAPVQMAQAAPAAPVASSGDPIRDVFMRLPPGQQALFARYLRNPLTAPAAMQRLQSMVRQDTSQIVEDGQGNKWFFNPATRSLQPTGLPGKPTEFQRFKGDDGTEYAWNPKDPTSKPIAISRAGGFRNLVTPEERAAFGIAADDKRPAQLKPNGELFFPSKAQTDLTVNNNLPKADSKFDETLAADFAKEINETLKDGRNARGDLSRIKQLRAQIEKLPGGFTGGMQALANRYGIKLGPNPDAVEAATAIINQLVPQQRPAGSGTMSDRDVELFKASLPQLSNTPQGNKTILDTMESLANYRLRQGEIATRVMTKKITREQAIEELNSLPDPFEAFNAATGQAPAQAPRSGPKKGDVVDGWTFLGGDPGDRKNWKK